MRKTPDHPVLITEEARLVQLSDAWDDVLAAPGPELSLATIDLRAFRELLTNALVNRPSWVRWNWWQLTNPGKLQLQQVATANNLGLSETDLQTLLTKVNQRIRLESIRYEVQPLLGEFSLPEQPESIGLIRRAKQLTERINDLEPLLQLPDSVWQTPTTLINTIKTLQQVAATVAQRQEESQSYMTINQLNKLWDDEALAVKLRQSLKNDFDLLIEADRLRENFSEIEQVVVERLSNYQPEYWAEIAEKSLRQAWLNHLETLYPELRSVSSLKMSQWDRCCKRVFSANRF